MTTLLNLLLGGVLKLITAGFSGWMEFSRQKELAILNADRDTILALQSGTDKADPWTRFTRRILALSIVGVWLFLLYWIVVVHPETEFKIFVNRSHSFFWAWLTPFPVNEKGIVVISAGSLLWEFKSMVEIIAGFYFTKIGK